MASGTSANSQPVKLVPNPFMEDENTTSTDTVIPASLRPNDSAAGIIDLLGEIKPATEDTSTAVAATQKQHEAMIAYKSNQRPEYEDYTFESMAGASSVVVFEFPTYNQKGSYFMVMKSIVTISVSVHRAKIPIIPLGFNTVQGYALGNKSVAGSIIKALTFDDEFDKVVGYYKEAAITDKLNNFVTTLGTKGLGYINNSTKYNITQKEFDSVMRDDIVPFNIHTYSISEQTGHRGRLLVNSIYGCTLINEGQVQSIENLITENTFSYIAKNAELGKTLHNQSGSSDLFPSYPSNINVMSGSRLLSERKR